MRLQRLLGMLCVLANVDKITIQELADRFEVSRRTIFRDLDTLNCAGIPIESLIFIFDGYADWEPAYLCSELNAPETEYVVKTVGLDKEPKSSMGGFLVLPDYSVEDFPKDFGLLVLCGGLAWMEQKNNAVLPLVEYAVRQSIPVGAICNAVK